jgi:hypothetical protein
MVVGMARRAVACCALLVLLLAPSAEARRHQPWATVNVCDTAKHPYAIGVRASMPGTDHARERMFMRFRVQWRDPADGLWHNLLEGGDSGFVSVGSARFRARQAGLIFRYEAPAAGARQWLRGVVRFEWRRGGRVIKAASRHTTGGHRSAAGSDPKGYSAATCVLAGD